MKELFGYKEQDITPQNIKNFEPYILSEEGDLDYCNYTYDIPVRDKNSPLSIQVAVIIDRHGKMVTCYGGYVDELNDKVNALLDKHPKIKKKIFDVATKHVIENKILDYPNPLLD